MAIRRHVVIAAGMLSELDSLLVTGNCLSTRNGLNQLSLPHLPTTDNSGVIK